MDLINAALEILNAYPVLISYFGAIFGGEETLIFLSVLSAQGHLNLIILAIFFYLGSITSDIIWVSIGKTRAFDYILKKRIFTASYNELGKILNKTTHGNRFETLLVTKFLYGFRIITLLYLSNEKMKVHELIRYSPITNAVWMFVIISIGYALGKGITLLGFFSNDIRITTALIGLSILLFTVLMRFVSEKLKDHLKRNKI